MATYQSLLIVSQEFSILLSQLAIHLPSNVKFVGKTKRQYKSINKLQETEGSQIDLLPRTNLAHFSKGKLKEDMYPRKNA